MAEQLITHLAIILFPLVIHDVPEDLQKVLRDERDRALTDILPYGGAVEK